MTAADLRHRNIVELAGFLDSRDRDWYLLGKQVLPEIRKNEIEFLRHGYTEEESLSRIFIDSLSTRLRVTTIMDFIKIAQYLRRNDIAEYLKRSNFKRNLPIWELPWSAMKVLLNYLESTARNDWSMFADELGYTVREIQEIEQKRRGYQSPTVLLFRMILNNKPELKIDDIIAVCANIRRDDVVEYLNCVMDKIMNS